MFKTAMCLSALAFCIVGAVYAPSHAATFMGVPVLQGEWLGKHIEYVQGQILIGLKPGSTQADFVAQLGRGAGRIESPWGLHGLIVLTAAESDRLFESIRQIAALPSVSYAEPNQIHHLSVIPNDPRFAEQWDLNNTGQIPPAGSPDADMDCPEGWTFTTGSSTIKVGILDTGLPVQNGVLSHPELDDTSRISLGGNFVGDGLPIDGNGHGTHVAGTVGAESNNGIGVAGIAWNCKIRGIKVFDDYGSGSDLSFANGVHDAVDHGCKVINYSGGGSAASSTMAAAIAYADTHNVVICVAAGNTYHTAVQYPAAYSLTYHNLICVSSTDANDLSSEFSSIGPEVTVCAPGGLGRPFDSDDILSTFPNYQVQLNVEEGLPQNYAFLAGTSMSSPHVAGLAALVFSMNPTLSADSVRGLICSGADDLGASGFDNYFGYGRINVYQTLLRIGNISIGHLPLADTKITTQPYSVDCSIYSVSALLADSLLLHYKVGSTWIAVPLAPAKLLADYQGMIPQQSPGTGIQYYLSARNVSGNRTQTPICTFKVIDYQVKLSPTASQQWVASQATSNHLLQITNDGLLNDHYNLTLSGNLWNTSIWDSAGLSTISATPTLVPNQQYWICVEVTAPASNYGDWDSARVKVTSVANATANVSAGILTTSLGVPLSIPATDQFATAQIDPAKWVHNQGTDISDRGLDEPSPPYSLHLDGFPDGADTIVSQVITLQPGQVVNLNYYYQKKGGGESPDDGDDLFIEYLDVDSNWVLLKQHPGSGTDMTTFREVSLPLPVTALHSGFRVRIRNTATLGQRDDWFVDNLSVNFSPQITVNIPVSLTTTLTIPDSTLRQIFISNAGSNDLTYDLEILPDYGLLKSFRQMQNSGTLEPASRSYAPTIQKFAVGKGASDSHVGLDVKGAGGGPDNFGYFWVSSDAVGGPAFDWIDIAGAGTAVSGLTDDSYAGPFPIGFGFDFYGVTYTDFYVSSNGFIGFGPPDNYQSPTNRPIPNLEMPNNIIALLWDDLDILDANNPGATIHYRTIGDRLVVQYTGMPEYLAGAGDVFTGELILSRDGMIRLQYQHFGAGFDKLGCTVGSENQDGFDGLGILYSAAFLHDSLAIVITTPSVSWLTGTPVSGVVVAGGSDTVDLKFRSAGLTPGSYGAQLILHNSDPDAADSARNYDATLIVQAPFNFGDANGDDNIDISDAIYIISYIFNGGPMPNPLGRGDLNCDGTADISDVVYLIAYIFTGGPAPCTATRERQERGY